MDGHAGQPFEQVHVAVGLTWDAMTRRSLGLSGALQQYVVEHSASPDKLELALIDELPLLAAGPGCR
jgi:hypothetical protein